MKKCFECLMCMEQVWVENNMYFWCDFCNKYYRIIDNKMVEVDNPNKIVEEVKQDSKPKTVRRKQKYTPVTNYEEILD